MVLPIPVFEPLLQPRYQHLLKVHLLISLTLAAGLPALTAAHKAFACTLAAWPFYPNHRLSLPDLAAPLLTTATTMLASDCQKYPLIMHACRHLHFRTHSPKTDRIRIGKVQAYQLQSSLLVSYLSGLPLVPLSLSRWAADAIHTTGCAKLQAECSHLDELTATIKEVEARHWSLPLIHLCDRESDSISHLRDWDIQQWRFVVRAKALPSVEWEGRRRRLADLAQHLVSHAGAVVQLTAELIAQQMVGQTEVWITRPGQRRVRRSKGLVGSHQPGQALVLGLIVVQLRLPDEGMAGEWLLLTNVGEEVTASQIAQCYYWRWSKESYFKLCKSGGHHLEEWQQESGEAVAKRLLIAALASVVVWQLQGDKTDAGEQLRQLLLGLSGRQLRPGQATARACLPGPGYCWGWLMFCSITMSDNSSRWGA